MKWENTNGLGRFLIHFRFFMPHYLTQLKLFECSLLKVAEQQD